MNDVVGYPWDEAVRQLSEQGIAVKGTVIGDRSADGFVRVIRQISLNGAAVLTGAEERWHVAP